MTVTVAGLLQLNEVSYCVTIIFGARQHAYACRARYSYGKFVRPSACLSHSGIVSKRWHTSSNSFHRLAGVCILLFSALLPSQNSKGNSLSEGVKHTGMGIDDDSGGSDVNKDWTCKDKDKEQAYKDQDKNKDLKLVLKDKDKDFTYSYLLQIATKPTIAIKQQQ